MLVYVPYLFMYNKRHWNLFTGSRLVPLDLIPFRFHYLTALVPFLRAKFNRFPCCRDFVDLVICDTITELVLGSLLVFKESTVSSVIHLFIRVREISGPSRGGEF